MWLSTWCLISVLFVHPSVIEGKEHGGRGTSLLTNRKQRDLPEFNPSKYIAGNPKYVKPFHIHFVTLVPRADRIGFREASVLTESEEMLEALDEVTAYVNQRLSAVIKARPIQDIRKTREEWGGVPYTCSEPMCLEVNVPGEYAHPCVDPSTGSITKEVGVPEKPTEKVAQLNSGKDITMVIFVLVANCSDMRPMQCHQPGWDAMQSGYAHSCQRDTYSNRPTHGLVAICEDVPDKWTGAKTKVAFLHEVLHILLSDNIVGFGSPRLSCEAQDVGPIPFSCEDVTYKEIQQDWLEANDTRTKRKTILVTTKNVKRAAQEYFHCPGLEGAETETGTLSEYESSTWYNWTVPPGTLYPFAHWSSHLFPDEIMSPYISGARKLSNLTLGLLKDLGWYDVNMSAAESMEITRPTEYGCDIAQKSCHENMQRARKENRSDIIALPNTGPYCDNDYTSEDRIVTLQCIDDMEPLQCDSLIKLVPEQPSPHDCGNILRPVYYDAYACEDSPSQGTEPFTFGGKVGPGTICVSVGPIYVKFLNETRAFGLCVNHVCDTAKQNLRLVLGSQNSGQCEMDCPAGMSNKQKAVSFNDKEHCKNYLGTEFQIICPNYTNVCVHLPLRTSTSRVNPVSTPTTRIPGLRDLTTKSQGQPLKCDARTIALITMITALTVF